MTAKTTVIYNYDVRYLSHLTLQEGSSNWVHKTQIKTTSNYNRKKDIQQSHRRMRLKANFDYDEKVIPKFDRVDKESYIPTILGPVL